MQTKSYHVSHFGSFGARLRQLADTQGYVTYHVSPRYDSMSDSSLEDMAGSHRSRAVRAAAATELAERAVAAWRAGDAA